MSDEPRAYQSEHVRDALLRDPRVGELDLQVTIDDGRVVVTGHVSTPERRDAVTEVVTGLLPDHEVRNDTTVSAFPEAPEEGSP